MTPSQENYTPDCTPKMTSSDPLYQPHLSGSALMKAARRVGQCHGESTYAQCMYCRDLKDKKAYHDWGYSSLCHLTETLWDWSRSKTYHMLAIAESIGDYSRLCQAFRTGHLSWTKARLILTALEFCADSEERNQEETKWLARLHLSYRQLEYLVYRNPDLEEDEQQPEMEYKAGVKWIDLGQGKVRVHFELPPDVYALLEKTLDQVRKDLYQEGDESKRESEKEKSPSKRLSYPEVIGALCRQVLSASRPETKVVAPAEITLNHCTTCKRTFVPTQQLGSVLIPKALEQHLSNDKSRTIPAATIKKVLERDHYHCAIANCRNHLWLHLHHIHDFAKGGGHEVENLVTLCSRHHRLLHAGKVLLSRDEKGNLCFQDRHWHPIGFPCGFSMPDGEKEKEAEAIAKERQKSTRVDSGSMTKLSVSQRKERIRNAIEDFMERHREQPGSRYFN